MAAKRKAAKRKSEGLGRPLFIAADDALHQALERIQAARRAQSPGVKISKADVARSLLWDGIAREGDR